MDRAAVHSTADAAGGWPVNDAFWLGLDSSTGTDVQDKTASEEIHHQSHRDDEMEMRKEMRKTRQEHESSSVSQGDCARSTAALSWNWDRSDCHTMTSAQVSCSLSSSFVIF